MSFYNLFFEINSQALAIPGKNYKIKSGFSSTQDIKPADHFNQRKKLVPEKIYLKATIEETLIYADIFKKENVMRPGSEPW